MLKTSDANGCESQIPVYGLVVVVALIWAERLAWNQISILRQENRAFVEKIAIQHPPGAEAFQKRADASLIRLQRFLFVALLCLLVSGATIVFSLTGG